MQMCILIDMDVMIFVCAVIFLDPIQLLLKDNKITLTLNIHSKLSR